MGSNDDELCPECYPHDDLVFYRDLPMNETLREHVRRYTGPAKMQHPDLASALAEWGQDFKPEDIA